MLDMLKQFMPLLYEAMSGKGTVVVFDREHYLDVKQGTRLALKVRAGDKLPPQSGAFEALKTGQLVIKENGPEVFGSSYYTVAAPFKADGEIIGGIAFLIPSVVKDLEEQLIHSSQELAQTTKEISVLSKDILDHSQNLTESAQSLLKSSERVGQHVRETERLLQFINSVSRNTKLLGLNASIEAARTGEYGRGFKIVAEEIHKMADSSANYAAETQTVILGINDLTQNEGKDIEQVAEGIRAVHTAIGQIIKTIGVIENTAENLSTLAHKI